MPDQPDNARAMEAHNLLDRASQLLHNECATQADVDAWHRDMTAWLDREEEPKGERAEEPAIVKTLRGWAAKTRNLGRVACRFTLNFEPDEFVEFADWLDRRPSQNELFLCDENARLQKELREERERMAKARDITSRVHHGLVECRNTNSTISLDWLWPLADDLTRVLLLPQPPTASARERQESSAGKKPSVESGWYKPNDGSHPTLEERGGLCDCKTDLSAIEITDGQWSSCRHCAVLAHRLCHAILDDPQHRTMTNWCEAHPGGHRVSVRMKPVAQASGAGQPAERTELQDARWHLERARGVGSNGVDADEVRAAVCCVVAHLEERLTGKHDAREGKANG